MELEATVIAITGVGASLGLLRAAWHGMLCQGPLLVAVAVVCVATAGGYRLMGLYPDCMLFVVGAWFEVAAFKVCLWVIAGGFLVVTDLGLGLQERESVAADQ